MVKMKENMTGWNMWEHGVPESRLKVIEQVDDYIPPHGRPQARLKCICMCGNEVVDFASRIKNGTKLSCGCIKEKRSGTRLYRIWKGMKSRCYNQNADHYDRYGGRGIVVCEEWKNDFVSFKLWAMYNGYQDDLTIDRIDNDGNYEPSNCRWVTMEQQGNNRKGNYIIEYNGESHTLSEWSKKTGIKVITLWDRINLLGWPIELALTTKNANEKLIEYNGVKHNIRQWAGILHINYSTLRRKIKSGESMGHIVEHLKK